MPEEEWDKELLGYQSTNPSETHMNVFPLTLSSPELTLLFNDMDSIWKKRDQNQAISSFLIQNLENELGKDTQGEIFTVQNEPVGVYWIKDVSENYGSLTLHVKNKKYAKNIVEHIIKKKSFYNKQLEIVQIEETPIFRDFFRELNLTENCRERMCLWLKENHHFRHEKLPFELTFYKTHKTYIEEMSELSYRAHQVSKDYWMFPEMNSLDGRIKMEKRMHDNPEGRLIEEASLMVFCDSKLIGFINNVGVKNCWGFKEVPWIFDIVIDPEYAGKGIGKELLKLSMNILTDLKYPIVGLSVTKNNYAKRLYKKLGFEHVDDFYEFIEIP
jgi:GNAT superfamily N-acetyltransferase